MATIAAITSKFGLAQLASDNPEQALPQPFDDPMWSVATILESRYDKLFPYQFCILKREGSCYKRQFAQTFTLPIPPEALSISTPFAISTSVTLGGIVEEHNGAPIRMISISGSTGHLAFRAAPFKPGVPSGVASVFGGAVSVFTDAGVFGPARTLSAPAAGLPAGVGTTNLAGLTTAGVGVAISSATNTGVFSTPDNIVTEADVSAGGASEFTTGYYQFHLLKQYLEGYANLKKTAAGRDYRLALICWKDNECYLVTPQSFDMRRGIDSPMEYRYAIALKAWRRLSCDELDDAVPTPLNTGPVIHDPTKLGQVLSKLQAARIQLQTLKTVLTGFSGDVESKVFQPLREVVGYCKDALGVGFTALDLPPNLLIDLKIPIILSVATGDTRTFNGQPLQNGSRLSAEVQAIRDELRGLADISGIGSTRNQPLASTRQQLDQQLQGQFRLGAGETDPISLIFDDPDSNADLFDSFPLGGLSVQPAVNKKIVIYKQNLRQLTRLDFETMRETLLQFIVDYSNFVGVGSARYASNYGLNAPAATTRTPTDDDWELMFALNGAVIEFGKLAASTAVDDRNKISALDYVAGLASQSGINFQVPASKFAVPFPTGSTLEMVAARYLGDPTRWIEIATLNNLKAPYVDEIGFNLQLLTNGHGSDIQVSDAANLYVNQPVWIQSVTAVRELRHVVGIKKLSDTVTVVTLDGSPNLDRFTTTAAAFLFAYLPQTVSSTQLLYLPSDKPPAEPDWQPKGNPAVDPFDRYLQVGGVDLLLTQDNDIFMTPDGDSRYAVGLQNITQRVRILLSTPIGSNIFHKEWGLAVQPGQTVADLSATQILTQLRTAFKFDNIFTDISSASVLVQPPGVTITAEVGIAGFNEPIPLSFSVAH